MARVPAAMWLTKVSGLDAGLGANLGSAARAISGVAAPLIDRASSRSPIMHGRLLRRSAAFAVALWGLNSPAVWAQVGVGYREVFEGVVRSGTDSLGLFGAAGTDLSNQSFRAVFFVNTDADTVSPYFNNEGQYISGGSYYSSPIPVTGEISISGSPYVIVGATGYRGEASMSGQSYPSGYSEQSFSADTADQIGSITTVLQASITTNTDRFVPFGESFSGSGYGSGGFRIFNQSTFTQIEDLELSPTVYAAPEPDTWTLMLAGIGMLGATMRIRKARRDEDAVSEIATA